MPPDCALTVKQTAERYSVKAHTVLAWIRRGELAAVDVSSARGGRPRWRITREALDRFELARTATPTPPRKRRRKQPAEIIEFY